MSRVFFAKMKKPHEIATKTFEQTASWLNGIDVGDYAFIRQEGKGIIELWKAEQWLTPVDLDHRKLQFSVVTTFSPVMMNAKQFVALKLFKLDLALLVFNIKNMRGLCFFPLQLAFPTAIDIIGDPARLQAYINDENNYRRVLVHDSAADIISDSEDVQIYKDGNGEFQLHPAPFIDTRVESNFKHENYAYGATAGGAKGTFYKAVESGKKVITRRIATLLGFYDLFCSNNNSVAPARSGAATEPTTAALDGTFEEDVEDWLEEEFPAEDDESVEDTEEDFGTPDPINKKVRDNPLVQEHLIFNTIFYGVPGCGKSYEINRRLHIGKIFDKAGDALPERFYKRILFHPEYSYSDFVGQIVPVSAGGRIDYKFKPGPFVEILASALNDPANHYFLIIEEINRGNAPAIFGDIFQLLDLDDRGESEYPIDNAAITDVLVNDLYVPAYKVEKVKIPRNLTLFATMNTSDQNVFTLDTAFKRRWRMTRIENSFSGAADPLFLDRKINGKPFTWRQFANALNEDILANCNDGMIAEDKLLGTHFVKKGELDNVRAFAEKIFMYLWNDVVKYNKSMLFRDDLTTLDKVISEFVKTNKNVFHEHCSNMAALYANAMAAASVGTVSASAGGAAPAPSAGDGAGMTASVGTMSETESIEAAADPADDMPIVELVEDEQGGNADE